MVIEVDVSNKIASLVNKSVVGVCGNSDYVIRFNFDNEWAAYETKTARFKYNGSYTDVIFTGTDCPMPIVQNTYNVEIGVYAGDLHTTTSAYLPMRKSILCGSGSPADPEPDVYNQLMDKLNNLDVKGYEELSGEMGNLDNLKTDAKDNLVEAINEAAKSGGGGVLEAFVQQTDTGATITITDKNGTTTADVANGANGDTGATPNIQIGSVSTLDAGSDATATITGTVENPLLNLGIPKGADGSSGSEKAWEKISTINLVETGLPVYFSIPADKSEIYLSANQMYAETAGAIAFNIGPQSDGYSRTDVFNFECKTHNYGRSALVYIRALGKYNNFYNYVGQGWGSSDSSGTLADVVRGLSRIKNWATGFGRGYIGITGSLTMLGGTVEVWAR